MTCVRARAADGVRAICTYGLARLVGSRGPLPNLSARTVPGAAAAPAGVPVYNLYRFTLSQSPFKL